jgi:hypothetical protein
VSSGNLPRDPNESLTRLHSAQRFFPAVARPAATSALRNLAIRSISSIGTASDSGKRIVPFSFTSCGLEFVLERRHESVVGWLQRPVALPAGEVEHDASVNLEGRDVV